MSLCSTIPCNSPSLIGLSTMIILMMRSIKMLLKMMTHFADISLYAQKGLCNLSGKKDLLRTIMFIKISERFG